MARNPSPDWESDAPTLLDSTPLIDTLFCVIDLETTGTAADSRITEIGAVKVRGGVVMGEFQTLVNPGVAIPGVVTDLTGISNATVADAPRLREVFASLVEFCRGCVMVAHNARFDMGFILRAAEGLGYTWPATTVLDTVALARHIIPRREVLNYKLGTLAQYFDTEVAPSHRALDDARATVDVLHGLFSRVGNQGVATLEDLLAYSHALSRSRRAKRGWAERLPVGPGVYFFVRDSDRGRSVLYVGTSKQIRRRVATYFTAAETRARMEEMVALATGVEAVECHTALEAAVVELRLISAHQPPYNRRSKHPRHAWIKVTTEPFPRFSVVRKVQADHAGYCGPFPGRAAAELAVAALARAFPLRTCTERLTPATPRDPCALAELAGCPAPCTGRDAETYRGLADRARRCLAGDVRPVRRAAMEAIGALSEQYRYEEAAEMLARLRAFESGLTRGVRLASLAGCPQIVAARRLGPAWEIHVFRYGLLAGAAIARPGEDPQRVADTLVISAKTVTPELPGHRPGFVGEAELVAAWLEQPGVRLIDIEGTWGWPVNLR